MFVVSGGGRGGGGPPEDAVAALVVARGSKELQSRDVSCVAQGVAGGASRGERRAGKWVADRRGLWRGGSKERALGLSGEGRAMEVSFLRSERRGLGDRAER